MLPKKQVTSITSSRKGKIKPEEINKQEEIVKREWNTPLIRDLDIDDTGSGSALATIEATPIAHAS